MSNEFYELLEGFAGAVVKRCGGLNLQTDQASALIIYMGTRVVLKDEAEGVLKYAKQLNEESTMAQAQTDITRINREIDTCMVTLVLLGFDLIVLQLANTIARSKHTVYANGWSKDTEGNESTRVLEFNTFADYMRFCDIEMASDEYQSTFEIISHQEWLSDDCLQQRKVKKEGAK